MPGIGDATLGWSDAPLHLFDGVFVLEFVKAWPINDARAWAERFYLRHPAIGISVYYPPGFAAIEAIVFSIFGVSVVAGRALVVAFAAGACLLLYEIGRNWFDRTTGLFAALLLLTMPHAALWMRDVMLEWPATFWILAAVAAYQRDLLRPRTIWALATWAAVLAAFMTKQTAGFIGPVIVLHAVFIPTRRAYWSRYSPWIGIAAAAVGIAAYAWITCDMTALASKLTAWSPDFFFYPRRLPEIAGWPFIAGMGLMAAWFRLWPRPMAGRIPLPATAAPPNGQLHSIVAPANGRLYFAGETTNLALPATASIAWFAFSSIIEAKESRYFFFALPFMALIAAAAFARPRRSGSWPRASIALITCVVIAQGWLSHRQWPAELPSYGPAVNHLAEQADADVVLIDAVRDGQFVFDVYDNPLTRDRIIPLRGSKLLYARAAREKYNYQQFVDSPADIVALLDQYGIRYIVMESQLPDTPYRDADPPPRQLLRDLINSDPRFKLCVDQSLTCGDPSWNNVRLRVYEYTTCPPRASDSITLSMPGMGGSVTLKLPSTQPVQ